MEEAQQELPDSPLKPSISPPANSSKALDLKKLLYLNYLSLRHDFMKEATKDPEVFLSSHRKNEPGFFVYECR
jgi:hypothetical protein